MAISVRQMLVKESKFKIKCPYPMDAEYITIHNTANDASAENEVQYMINNSNAVSYHFAVDDKEVVQGILTDRNAWHCGDGAKGEGNRKSIGVEICYSKSGGTSYYKAEGLAIQFVAQLLRARGWGIDRVKKHQDWSGKYCPHRILEEGRWQSVLNAIEKELNALNNPIKVASNEEEGDIMAQEFKPSVGAINDSVKTVLARFEQKDPALAASWRKKFNDGELTISDAVGLLYVAVERGYIVGE